MCQIFAFLTKNVLCLRFAILAILLKKKPLKNISIFSYQIGLSLVSLPRGYFHCYNEKQKLISFFVFFLFPFYSTKLHFIHFCNISKAAATAKTMKANAKFKANRLQVDKTCWQTAVKL